MAKIHEEYIPIDIYSYGLGNLVVMFQEQKVSPQNVGKQKKKKKIKKKNIFLWEHQISLPTVSTEAGTARIVRGIYARAL